MLASIVFGLPAIHVHQAFASLPRRVAGPIAVERAVDTGGPDVRDGRHLDVLGVDRTDQHISFVARSDDADPHRVGDLVVAEVHGAQADAGNRSGSNHVLDEVAARNPHRFVVVVSTDFFVFRGKIHDFFSCFKGQQRRQSKPRK